MIIFVKIFNDISSKAFMEPLGRSSNLIVMAQVWKHALKNIF